MKTYEFTEDYDKYKKGDVIPMRKEIYYKFIHPLFLRGILKVIQSDKDIREKVEEEIEDIEFKENQGLIDKLSEKKMRELQDFGRKYGASDTKKDELIEEILEKVPSEKITEFIEG